jgi:hypothetical protein
MDYLSPAAIADSAFAKAAEVVFEGRRSAHPQCRRSETSPHGSRLAVLV